MTISPEQGEEGEGSAHDPSELVRREDDAPSLYMDVGQNLIENTQLIAHTGQKIYFLPRDRIELALRRTLNRYTDVGALISKWGIVVAFLLALLTTDTKQFLGIDPEVWLAVLLMLTTASLAWAIYGSFKFRHRVTLNDILEEITKRPED